MTSPNTPWVDGPDGGTPVSAERLNNIEERVTEARDVLDGRLSGEVLDETYATRTKYDVIVVGGTEIGVMAAVAAARERMNVLLVSSSERIGGVTGWAITITDVQSGYSPNMFGGLVREYWNRVAPGIGNNDGYFERWHRRGGPGFPSWCIRAFDEMLAAEPTLTVMLNAPLTAIEKSGTEITEATLGGRKYSAPVWIDATPTGDLIQRACASTSIGREGIALYSEPEGAGVMNPAAMQGGATPDPYITAGNAASGLLPGVSPEPVGTIGSGDGRVMTFGWRLFLTSKTVEKLPWPTTPPEGYNPLDYELLARAWASNPTYFNDADNAVARTFQVYSFNTGGSSVQGASPYHHIDLNSLGFLSSNYPRPDECREYITADPSRRLQIETNAKRYLLGLFHFILHSGDARIPANLIAGLNKYGPSNQELKAYGGISPQFYVREGCRVVGDYVMTYADTTLVNGVTDYIGYLVYNFDGHPVRAVVSAGVTKFEGSYDSKTDATKAGAPIPYRILLPKSNECTNLLCPGQPSTSRYVHSAIRAVPIMMQIGEAAGYAAAESVREGSTVQAVTVAKVQSLQNLQRLKGAITASMQPTGQPHTSQASVTQSGAGTPFAPVTANQRWGPNWPDVIPYAVPAGTERKVKIAPNINRAGMHRVRFLYPPSASTDTPGVVRASNVTVTISHADGTTTRSVNQRYPGGEGGHDDLGIFYFRRGQPSTDYVEIDAAGSDGLVTVGMLVLYPLE